MRALGALLCWLGFHHRPRHRVLVPGYPRFGGCVRCGDPYEPSEPPLNMDSRKELVERLKERADLLDAASQIDHDLYSEAVTALEQAEAEIAEQTRLAEARYQMYQRAADEAFGYASQLGLVKDATRGEVYNPHAEAVANFKRAVKAEAEWAKWFAEAEDRANSCSLVMAERDRLAKALEPKWRTDLPPWDERPSRQFIRVEGCNTHSGATWRREWWDIARISPEGHQGYRTSDMERIARDGDMDFDTMQVVGWMPAALPTQHPHSGE